jgi:hypothetical protein
MVNALTSTDGILEITHPLDGQRPPTPSQHFSTPRQHPVLTTLQILSLQNQPFFS